MAEIKTRPTGVSVTEFLDAIPEDRRRADGRALRALFERVTGEPATMWGPTMIGFGTMLYTNKTGTNDWFILGFSPRKPKLVLYGIHDGYAPNDPLLAKLGPHSTGKSCLYIKTLDDVDQKVLDKLVVRAWKRWKPA